MMKGVGERDGDSTIMSGQLEYRLDGYDAQACVVASHSPSVHVYYALRSQLERSSATWMQEFVSLGGLDSLLDSLCQMTGKTFTSFSDAILQIDCISCIRAVLNTHVGINYLLQSPSAANKLVMGLEIGNTLPKKQIVEMASAFCAHSAMGYQRILEGLDHLKRETNQYHRFSIVVNELKSAETVPHKTAVMTFINTVISCNKDLNQRCRLRNQMIGLTLLDVINFLQREETDDDLHIQLQTFHESKHQDEETLRGKSEEDLSSPSELTEALQSQVFGTGRMVSLVNILQDLLAIELLDKHDKDKLWGVVEQQVHHLVHSTRLSAGLLSSLTPRQVDDLLLEETQITQSLVSQVAGFTGTDNHTNTISTVDNNNSTYDNFLEQNNNPVTAMQASRAKTPEPDLLGDLNNLNNPTPTSVQALKPDLRLSSKRVEFAGLRPSAKQSDFADLNVYLSRPSLPHMPGQLPAAYDGVTTRRGSLDGRSYQKGLKHSRLRMVAVPFPSHPMRNLKWVKIQDSVLEWSKGCVWEPREVIPRFEPDYNRIETLFAETHILNVNDEVALLAGETRLKINLFLNRLEVEPDELVRNLIDTEAKGLTLPLLKYLHDILPCHDEMVMLKQYNGSLLDIGMAEQFLLHLMDIPDYHTLMLGHLTRLQFSTSISRLQRALKAMVTACVFLLDSQPLRDLLQLVLRVGNFLNHGQFNGDAGGLRLNSLKRLKDVSCVEPNHTLLHQVVGVVEECDDQMLRVLNDIPKLDEAARHSPEEIRNEVTALNAQLKQFVVQLTSAHPNITDIFHSFLESVKKDFSEMQRSIAELRELSQKVALYVCEPTSTFNLQTCLKHLVTFLKDIRKARHENSLYKRQRTQARRRSDQFKTKLKHKRLALEFGKEARASSSMTEDRKKIMERILTELHHGNFHPVIPLSDLSTPEQEEPPSLPADSHLKQITPIPQTSQRNTPTSSKATTPVRPLTPARKKGPLELSRISLVGTPMINRPCSEIFDDDLFHFTPKYPARGKVMTSSANDLLEEKPPKQQEENTQEEHQKPLHAAVDLMKPTSPPLGHHHRSRSDLTDSILIQNKWLKYEEIKRKERKNLEGENAPLAEPESSLTLATLNLEDMRARRRVSDQMQLNTGPVLFMPQGHKDRKGDKKGGIGSFFSRLSRAVLKPRNATTNVEINILRPSQLPEKGKTTKSSSEGMDKENFIGGAEDPKRSSKRMGRFRLNKLSV